MTPADRADLIFSIRMAFRTVPPGTWREVSQRKPTIGKLAATGAAEVIVDYLLRSGWRIEKEPPAPVLPGYQQP